MLGFTIVSMREFLYSSLLSSGIQFTHKSVFFVEKLFHLTAYCHWFYKGNYMFLKIKISEGEWQSTNWNRWLCIWIQRAMGVFDLYNRECNYPVSWFWLRKYSYILSIDIDYLYKYFIEGSIWTYKGSRSYL